MLFFKILGNIFINIHYAQVFLDLLSPLILEKKTLKCYRPSANVLAISNLLTGIVFLFKLYFDMLRQILPSTDPYEKWPTSQPSQNGEWLKASL